MRNQLFLVFCAASVFCLVSGTEKLSSNKWPTFSHPHFSGTFPNLYRNAEALKDTEADQTTTDSHDQIIGMIRLQSARVAEMTLAAKSIEEMRCFQRSVCIVGATIPTKETTDETRTPMVGKSRPITLAKGIEQFRKMLELMTDTIKGTPTTSMKDFPVIQQVLGSHTAGASTKDISLCETLFPCSAHASDLDIPTHRREGRATCKAINTVCPGISIGCALCAGFLPGQCGDQCIIAGIYCGSSLIACGQQKKNLTKRKPKLTPAGLYF